MVVPCCRRSRVGSFNLFLILFFSSLLFSLLRCCCCAAASRGRHPIEGQTQWHRKQKRKKEDTTPSWHFLSHGYLPAVRLLTKTAGPESDSIGRRYPPLLSFPITVSVTERDSAVSIGPTSHDRGRSDESNMERDASLYIQHRRRAMAVAFDPRQRPRSFPTAVRPPASSSSSTCCCHHLLLVVVVSLFSF